MAKIGLPMSLGQCGEVWWVELRGWYEAQVVGWEWSLDERSQRVSVHEVVFDDGTWTLDLMSRNRCLVAE